MNDSDEDLGLSPPAWVTTLTFVVVWLAVVAGIYGLILLLR